MTEKSVVDIPIGSVVLANAGRDKGRYFVAVAASGGFVYISSISILLSSSSKT